MTYDKDKVDDTVLALLFLTMCGSHHLPRAWKGHDWAVLDRLHAKGYIADPKSKDRSVAMTEEGRARAEELFNQLFGTDG
jgi:hypothetical protein